MIRTILLALFTILVVVLFPQPAYARGGCFTGDTLIRTPSGNIPIRLIRSGDAVVSVDPQTGERAVSSVGEVQKLIVNSTLLINGELHVTDTHPFFVKEGLNISIKQAGELRAGDLLFNDQLQAVRIVSIQRVNIPVLVYNLVNVAPIHTYIAGGFLVHNKGGAGGGGVGGFGGYSGRPFFIGPNGRISIANYCGSSNAAVVLGCEIGIVSLLALIWIPILLMIVASFVGFSIEGIRRRKQIFSNDPSLVTFTKSIVPNFLNKYSLFYTQDVEQWERDEELSKIDDAVYVDFITTNELQDQIHGLFEDYETDWSKRDFVALKKNVEEPFFTNGLSIYKYSFGNGHDIVYQPEIYKLIPINAEKVDEKMKIVVQLFGRMINFEVNAKGKVHSGEPFERNFTEYWTFLVDKNKNVSIWNIEQEL
ncbi:MAG TPA: Hint domain-containing protein [Patescibacteria group bacterium]|nr:Hint domain-containing protein [Patescibacteria group bacterium]